MNPFRKEIIVPPAHDSVRRVWQLAAVLGFVMVVILYKIWSLQVLEEEYYRVLSEQNYEEEVFIPSPRGRILDRWGRVLAQDVDTYDVYLDGTKLNREQIKETISRLKVMGLPIVRGALGKRNPDNQYLIAKGISFEQNVELLERRMEFPGVIPKKVPGRHYPYKDLAAHVIGYTREIDRKELQKRKDQGYKQGDRLGTQGIEYAYESFLRGQDGIQIVQKDATGHTRDVLREDRKVQPGQDLVLSIDLEIQRVCEEVLGASRGSIIVTNPQNGAVLAMASSPRYDLNKIRLEIGQHYQNNHKPLEHRAIRGLYPPGSTFKLFESVGILESGFNVNQTVFCGGSFRFGRNTWRCHKREGHGHVDLYHALELSCDVYYYTMGNRLKLSRIADWAEQFGLGHPTGIDLPGEKSRLFPCKANGYNLYPGETINIAIGQGKIEITPMQLAIAAGALANATGGIGTVYRPRVALGPLKRDANGALMNEEGHPVVDIVEPQVAHEIHAATSTWTAVQKASWMVCNSPRGTGRRCVVEGMQLAGKTGTAQHGGDKNTTHAWFVCWGPAGEGEIPQIMVVILAEEAGHGGENASVLVPPIIEAWLRGAGQELV